MTRLCYYFHHSREDRKSLKDKHVARLCQSRIMNVALGIHHMIGDYSVSFSDNYMKDPGSYVNNRH